MSKIAQEIETDNDRRRQLTDMFARSISYLRVSLTDQCNLRCLYCNPQAVVSKQDSSELLSYEELLRLIRLAVRMGITKVRLTGGEPLVRRGIEVFVRGLAQIQGLDDIRLTTNGVLLARYADDLLLAGVRKLNISLDTLRPKRFAEITGRDLFHDVWRSINKVGAMGFASVKINIVAMKGVNDDEFADFAALALERNLEVRFIEFMPVGQSTVWSRDRYISAEDIRNSLSNQGSFEPVGNRKFDGPARMYRLTAADGRSGMVGFISPISHRFCDKCNRLRLTSEGRLRSCLLSDEETDIKTLLRNGAGDDELSQAIVETILAKPEHHSLFEKEKVNCHGEMSRIGG